MKQTKSAGHLAALFTILVWGTTFISTKVLLADFQPVEILFFRFVLGLRAQLDQCHGKICLQIRPAAGIIKQYARALPARESAAVLRAWDGPGRAAPGKEKITCLHSPHSDF